MPKISGRFVVRGAYRIGFDNSYSSYEAGQDLTVELLPGEDRNTVEQQVHTHLQRKLVRVAEDFKAVHDTPRPPKRG